MSIDVEMQFFGASNSSIVLIPQPVNLNGYLVVQMAQQGIDIVSLWRLLKLVAIRAGSSD